MTMIEANKFKIGQFVDYVAIEKPIDIAPTSDCRWLVLMTEPNRVFTVTANLTLRKVAFYVPTELHAAKLPARQHQQGKDHPDVVKPIFPGIVFVPEREVAAKEGLIRSTYGVLTSRPFMRFGEEVAIVRPSAMAIIHGIEVTEREAYLEKKGRPNVRFAIGDQVRAAVGELLGGHNGTIEAIDDHGRITLLMDIFKRKVRVHLSQDQVEPL
ncbi:hypothetical protein LPW26_06020 [Rhodopseudomonas sp. HC1]|uniref:transcription termination/antitermination protein NusG n=1 Tax=Rhodopseudomonas infernalis TaxID=2897386 RepID=UPI001EE987FB|nr:transcription termination/antitermination NusG family protein [Rhodopseudomonas infernalis]MCG6204183.1 hypothetical protein [Rhodopseudomonas infernalis]